MPNATTSYRVADVHQTTEPEAPKDEQRYRDIRDRVRSMGLRARAEDELTAEDDINLDGLGYLVGRGLTR